MKVKDEEQRQAWRSPLRLELSFEGAGMRAETRISDISITGVYIETVSAIPVASNLKLAFTLPNGYVVNTEGIVVHSQPQTGVGVKFVNLDPNDARLIREFIRA